MKSWKNYFEEFKNDYPIRDCLGSTGGRWKWRRYLDGIDLRYGHPTKRSAQVDRAKCAREEYAVYLRQEEKIPCSICGEMYPRADLYPFDGHCWPCEKKSHSDFYSHY